MPKDPMPNKILTAMPNPTGWGLNADSHECQTRLSNLICEWAASWHTLSNSQPPRKIVQPYLPGGAYTDGALHCVSKKNDNDVLRYNFNAHQPILIIFGRDIAE